MKTRRKFLKNTAFATVGIGLSHHLSLAQTLHPSESNLVSQTTNPWIELSSNAYLKNVQLISQMAQNKPIMAVLKNNAYGLGDVQVAQILDQSTHIAGFALVKDERCLALRGNGVSKPILLMGDFNEDLGMDLVNNAITLSAFSLASSNKIKKLASQGNKEVLVELYIDTGLGRMGMPYSKGVGWIKELASTPNIKITGLFSTLTTPVDFAQTQIQRFSNIIGQLKDNGIIPSRLHMAPSLSLLDLPESHFNTVRPGILLHGTYPLSKMDQAKNVPLQLAYRLKAPVIRMEKLRKGDTIGFSRFYKVEADEWTATLPIGWADGYYSGAENGAKVLINDTLYNVVNVNASHCNLAIGPEKTVDVGDIATLIGPDQPEITPEGFGKLAGGHNYLQIQYKESIPKFVHDEFL
ncbi:alanine racemase [Flagellimonas sp.]|uniref:alanine racemase n=1 Tax=Flagellimonas sp. TaxID=2058762 RepID=UPI003BB06DE4